MTDPLAALRYVEGKGGKVEPLGTKQVGQWKVWGYAITTTKQLELRYGRPFWQKMGLSRQEISKAEQAVKAAKPETDRVWIDGSGFLRAKDVEVNSPISAARCTRHSIIMALPCTS